MKQINSMTSTAAGAVAATPAEAPRASRITFGWLAAIVSVLIGTSIGLGASFVRPMKVAAAMVARSATTISTLQVSTPPRVEPRVVSKQESATGGESPSPVDLKPVVSTKSAPRDTVVESAPPAANTKLGRAKSATVVVLASGKSRMQGERRHSIAVPRVEDAPAPVDREHDFSFLPSGHLPPKDRLKPLSF